VSRQPSDIRESGQRHWAGRVHFRRLATGAAGIHHSGSSESSVECDPCLPRLDDSGTLNCMKRAHAALWASIAILCGAASLYYLLAAVPPFADDGRMNLPAVIGFFGGAFLLLGGAGTMIAMPLHERWPSLAGVARRSLAGVPPEAALRQGILFGLAGCVLLLLALLDLFDPAFVLAVLMLTGLLEAFWQSWPGNRI